MPVEARDFLWSRTKFKSTELGSTILPAVMENRWRHRVTAEGPIRRVTTLPSVVEKLQGIGVSTVYDLLRLDKAQYAKLPISPNFRNLLLEGLGYYFEPIAFGPEGRLLQSLFGAPQSPVPIRPDLEPLRQEAVQQTIALIPDEAQRTVLIARFGLDDGVSQSLEEVAKSMGKKTREQVRQIETPAMRNLRLLRRHLQPFFTYAPDSFATKVFGVGSYYEFIQKYGFNPSSVSDRARPDRTLAALLESAASEFSTHGIETMRRRIAEYKEALRRDQN